MNKVMTVFQVGNDNYKVNAVGQEAADLIMGQFPGHKIILLGFIIDNMFFSWDR